MPIRTMIDSGSYPPEALAVVYEAFDLAWTEIAERFGSEPMRIEFARTALAQAIMSAAATDTLTDAAQLKSRALEVLESLGLANG